MHKDIKVLKIKLTANNLIESIVDIYDFNHLPFSTGIDIKTNHKAFSTWWSDRSIPLARDDYSTIQSVLPGDDSFSLVVKAHALSLDDQYWIRQEDENISYDDISFFTNKFNDDIGNIIVGIKENGIVNYYSPDSTSNGNLKKRWKIINGKKYLLKAGSKPNQYEIFNEIIASKVMDLLNIEHVDYEFVIDHGHIYCASQNFVSYNEDFVTAYQLKCSKSKANHISLYDHLLSICKSLKIPNCKEKINQMLLVDYILGNTDRHFNNFGVIRDAKTLEFLRMAPIYDTGSCLGYDLNDEELNKSLNCDWKPFQSQKIKTQLDLIDDYSWLDFNALKIVPREIYKSLESFSKYISPSRRNLIVDYVVRKINYLYNQLGISEQIKFNSEELSILEKMIIDYLKNHNGELLELDSLMKETGNAYITIYRAISKLVEKGLIKRVGSRKTGYWVLL